jgi:hypothetical protein
MTFKFSIMKPIHEKDPRTDRDLFFEAASICEYSTGGDLLNHNKTKKTRKKHFQKVGYRSFAAEFQHSAN